MLDEENFQVTTLALCITGSKIEPCPYRCQLSRISLSPTWRPLKTTVVTNNLNISNLTILIITSIINDSSTGLQILMNNNLKNLNFPLLVSIKNSKSFYFFKPSFFDFSLLF